MKLSLSEKEIQKLVESVVPNPDNIDINAPAIDQAKLEVKRCTEMPTGFLYFLLTYIVYKTPAGEGIPAKEKTYKWQKKAAVIFLLARMIIFYKTRQTGSSTLKQAHDLWKAIFFENQNIFIFSLGQNESNEYLEKLEFMYEKLPTWLRTNTVEKNKSTIKFTNGSTIKSKPNTEKGARSGTLSTLVLDEYAFYPKRTQSKILSGSSPALGPTSNLPFTNKTQPSQLFIVSTLPETVTEGNEYMRIFRKAQDEPDESSYYIIKVDTSDISFYQSQEWHKEQLDTLGQRKYDTEIRGIIHSQMENAFLSPQVLSELEAKNPIRCDFLKRDQVDETGIPIDFDNFAYVEGDFEESIGYIKGLWVWKNPVPGHYYGLMGDISSGGSTDYSAFHVIDLDTMEQVAEYRHKINTPDYRRIIVEVSNYYNNSKICVERTGLGVTICQELGAEFPERFYFHRVSKHNYIEGFPTSTNRGNVLGVFEKSMDLRSSDKVKINSIRTINELRNFGFNARGKVEALEGNDDLTMALALFVYLREIFFFSENKMKDEIEEMEANIKDEDTQRAKHFIFSSKADEMNIEFTEESKEFIQLGYGIPTELLNVN